MEKLRKGYVAIDGRLMTNCRPEVREELFGTTRICGGCYMDVNGNDCDCIVDLFDVVVPKRFVAIIKMNQYERK